MKITSRISCIIILLFIFHSCAKEKKTISSELNGYVLSIIDSSKSLTKAYLYSLRPFTLIDSTQFIDGTAYFKDSITFPERFYFRLSTNSEGKLIILERDSIDLVLQGNNLSNATILGSAINDKLLSYQQQSEQINNKIELLFPDIQRARLENNGTELNELIQQLNDIESENIAFSLNFTKQFPDSFISAMILNDLLQHESIDSNQIRLHYSNLSEHVKQGKDAKLIELKLGI